MNKTKIEWSEGVWNVVTGCSKIRSGCQNCYAESFAKRFWGKRKFTDVQMHWDKLGGIYHIKKPSIIFVNSMGDLFHEKVSYDFMYQAFIQMIFSPKHTFIILTKRPDNMLAVLNRIVKESYFDLMLDDWNSKIPKNIIIGISVSTQREADNFIPLLLKAPVNTKVVSIEPLLENISLREYLTPGALTMFYKRVYLTPNAEKTGMIEKHFEKDPLYVTESIFHDGLQWVIVGAETGLRKRDCSGLWIKDIVDECRKSKVPVFVKQVQMNKYPDVIVSDSRKRNYNARITIKDFEKFPKKLRVREYPEVIKEMKKC